jgi:iron complex outermembrane receptor protein
VTSNSSILSLEEVVVTAQRRADNLQDVPVSVTSISAAQLARAAVTSTEDLGMVTPGLTLPETSGALQPHIRGVGTSANGPGIESPVAMYVDGI